MISTPYFKVTVGGLAAMETISLIANEAVYPGMGVNRLSTDKTVLALAETGDDVFAFVGQQAASGGPSYEDKSRPTLPLEVDLGGTITCYIPKRGCTIEAEGGENATGKYAGFDCLLVTSGTGLIDASTAVGTELSFHLGQWRVAQSGDVVCGVIVEDETAVTSSNIRKTILVEYRGTKA